MRGWAPPAQAGLWVPGASMSTCQHISMTAYQYDNMMAGQGDGTEFPGSPIIKIGTA